MAHSLEFLHNGFHPARADQEYPIREPAGNVLGQLFAGQQFFREHCVLSLHEAHPPV
jgi:hypothetical protein